MAALVAAIHVFGVAKKDVDGRDEPGHDEEKDPAPLTNINRAAVGLARRSTFARCREMAGSVAGHDAETACSPLNLAPMGLVPGISRGPVLVRIPVTRDD